MAKVVGWHPHDHVVLSKTPSYQMQGETPLLVVLQNICLFILKIFMYLTLLVGLGCNMWALSCGMQDLVPWPGIEPGPPALGAWSLNCWTPRESSSPISQGKETARLWTTYGEHHMTRNLGQLLEFKAMARKYLGPTVLQLQGNEFCQQPEWT